MKKKVLFILCALPLLANAQVTVQVLSSVESYIDGNNGVKYEYQYDNNGVATSETCSHWDSSNNVWIENSKCEYQYDNANNRTWITLYWDSGSNVWVESKKIEYQYINANNQTWITYYWDSGNNAWVANKKYEYQYDSNNNQTLETYYIWDNTWTEISTAQYNYSYSSITVNDISQVNSGQPTIVFPNPATNYITVKGITGSLITVSDLSGKTIYKQPMAGENGNIDVSSWASGVYIISVEKGNNRTVSKIIKK